MASNELPSAETSLMPYSKNGRFVRYRRPNPVDEEDTMLRFGK